MSLPLNITLFDGVLTAESVQGDVDDFTKSGFYFVDEAVMSAPTHNACHLLVNNYDDGRRVLQLYVNDTTDESSTGLWYRQCIDSTWSSWQHFVTMDQVTAEVTRILTTAEF